jgi:hypothetical protein
MRRRPPEKAFLPAGGFGETTAKSETDLAVTPETDLAVPLETDLAVTPETDPTVTPSPT